MTGYLGPLALVGTLGTVDAVTSGRSPVRPLLGVAVVALVLSVVASGSPELAGGIALVLLITSLFTTGDRLRNKIGF